MGIRTNRTDHALFGNFMIGKVADCLGVLNSIRGTDEQMFFADYDTSSLHKIYSEIANLRIKDNMGYFLVFQSEMKNQNTHYFIISPFRYSKDEIKQMLISSRLIDKKFISVYMRDEVNAIRFLPKIIGNKQSRFISLIDFIPAEMRPERLCVRGMISLIHGYYPNLAYEWDLEEYSVNIDITEKSDLTLREYETIRW